MGRTASGCVRKKANRWMASVPKLADAPKRLECSFVTKAEAWAWIDAQLRRRAAGLEPEKPRRDPPATAPATETPASSPSSASPLVRTSTALAPTVDSDVDAAAGPAHLPSLCTLAWAWHHEYYEELENAGPDRAASARRNLELHILPAFGALLGYEVEAGRNLVKDWLRVLSGRRPHTPGSPFAVGKTIYGRQTANGYLWLLRQILAYGRALGYEVPQYAEGRGIHALHPLGRAKKRRAPLVSVEMTGVIAGQLHVIHQSVLWLLRLGGLRISESYGLSVANFFVDPDGDGFLLAQAQGGRPFRQRADDGRVTVTDRKESGKTDAAYRLIALPGPMTALLCELIEVFHTAADGSIDPTARLVPTIRAQGGGQGGFRGALRAAAAAIGGPDDEDAYVVPHDLRKSFATDLAWAEDVSGLVARRTMGHRAGGDVFDLVYTLDSRLKAHLAPVAHQVEREIARAGLATLMVGTVKRPVYASDLDPVRVALIDGQLEACGWQRPAHGELLRTAEVAAIVGLEVGATRRLFPGKIPATKIEGEWWCAEDDARAFAERMRGYQFMRDVVERAGVDYFTVYRMMEKLGIKGIPADRARGVLLTDVDADVICAEVARIARLRERSVRVAEAAVTLRTSTTMIYQWAKRGRLTYDDERDAAGARYVTRASVEAMVPDRFRRRRRPAVATSEFKEMTGFSDADVKALVTAKLLVRVLPDGFTPASVRAWAAGHRPALLADPLLRRTA